MTPQRWALVAATISALIVGIALVATGSIAEDVGPATIAFMRYLIAVLFLLPLAVSGHWLKVRKKDFIPIALLGIFQFAILIVLLNYSIIHIDVGLAVLIFATLPLLTMLIAVMLGQEVFTLRKLAGIVITIIGVSFAVGFTAFTTELEPKGWLGIGAAFLSALTGAICSVFYKPYLQRYPTVQVSIMAMAASVIFLLAAVFYEGHFDTLTGFDASIWLTFLFIGICSGAGYFAWLFALKHMLPSNVTVFMGISPISAAVFGAIFIAQPLTIQDIVGSVFVAVGLMISLWQKTDGNSQRVKRAL
ncbi:DMT family transporter [Sneathiella marina]|uniref:DMT family transporter n=1 Tax=Sneathiella marina TaxID=2950108 RepID=A0ABY4W5X6_9PROT|nr:DMT family transporter [Sneathiella marina]USG62219.1 DMT family transporter [Sneathiella marina]